MIPLPVLLAAALLALPGLPRPGEVELPDGPAARAWAGVGPETVARELSGDWLERAVAEAAGGAEGLEAEWTAWAAWLAGEAAATEPDPRRRSALALHALRQGRWGSAWRHFEALGATPEWAAAVMPHFLPGAPTGRARALPDGALLRPAVPPASGEAGAWRFETREAWARGVRIGAAEVELRVLVEAAGVELTLRHTGGGPTTFQVLLPEPAGMAIRVEYLDWMRQDTLRQPLPVSLAPGGEPVVLFGRFLPSESRLPATPAGALPPQLARGGLWLEVEPLSSSEPLARAAATALGRALDVPAGLRRPSDPPSGAPWSGTVVRVPDGAEAGRLLASIAAAAEDYLLSRPHGR